MMGGYVPWDVKYLSEFYDRVLAAIGNGTNVGIVIFGILVAILVAILVVRFFLK